MCGISGIVTSGGIEPRLLEAAELSQAHRGPDGRDRLVDASGSLSVALFHQRLAIIDTSDGGRQPMTRGACTISFNGEIYNYVELRRELTAEGLSFSTGSDTEVLLTAILHWGLERTLPRLNGMWAFALLDRNASTLILCRDRVGVKPLYYVHERGKLYFASEIKTILAMDGRRRSIRAEAVSEFLGQSILDATDNTFFEGVRKVPAGTSISIELDGVEPRLGHTRSFWDGAEIARREADVGVGDAVERLRDLLESAVALRLRSDVPVGVLLSGGLDSSAIAAIARRKLSPARLTAIGVVSDDTASDESAFINRVARHIDCDIEHVAVGGDALASMQEIENTTWQNDEPIAGLAVVAQSHLMRRARELGITVLLSGQGADELLCGYNKYYFMNLQELVRRDVRGAARELFSSVLSPAGRFPELSIAEARRYLTGSRFAADLRGSALQQFPPRSMGLTARVQDRQALDITRLSVPILVHYEDRTSMRWGREVRQPFLDYRLLEAFLPAPVSVKMQRGWSKFVLREAVADLLPSGIVWRRDKRGFAVPEARLLRTKLVPAVREHFSPDAEIFRRGFVDRAALMQRYAQFCAGSRFVSAKEILAPFLLEVWLRRFAAHLSDGVGSSPTATANGTVRAGT